MLQRRHIVAADWQILWEVKRKLEQGPVDDGTDFKAKVCKWTCHCRPGDCSTLAAVFGVPKRGDFMPEIDKKLLARTQDLARQFDLAIAKLADSSSIDLRIFFTMAHGYITDRIAQCASLFDSPNALMRLNDSFATEYLRALNGHPHADWSRAFRVCRAESNAVESGFVGLIFVGPVAAEACGACMANVHIKRDLRDALGKVKDVDPQDYGNMLVLVSEGNLYAESQLRDRVLGTAAFLIGQLFVTQLNLNVKQWRNDVYMSAYGKTVPDPTPAFAAAYRTMTTSS